MEFVQPIRDRKQLEAMKRYLKGSSLRDYCLFVLGINSGLRVSDLLNLTIADVVDEQGKLRDRITLREKKTGKAKDFPLSDSAKKAISEYLKQRGEYAANEPLFPSRKGGAPLTRQHAYRILNEAARAVGIKEQIGTHTLRKTFGYHAYQSGVDISRLQKLLNHSAPSVTLAYIGITQEELDEVYLNLNL
ncbi:site-specific integrase [Alicyclobacillus sendaiensis]|uniref:site-specific integrase n=1 Tax=Alicyclobacillus sendaiensis TaxID=192387 RepID=UPI0026F42FD5|nr:site-specific integrase [Alicyclobacillus sendaiensis]